MASKKEIKPQVTITRKCQICREGFTLSHPNDPRMFCDKCVAKLRKLIEESEDDTDG